MSLVPINRQVEVSRQRRDVERRADQVRGDAIVAAVFVQAVGFVTGVSLEEVERISARETELIKRTPLGAPRYQSIGDTATLVMAGVINGMGRRW